ncbi:MAG TPA: hypothetical protein VGL99_07625 [Chloroflexota bacterium]
MDTSHEGTLGVEQAVGAVQLSRFRAEQLASAFELTETEVQADAPTIAHWQGPSSELYGWLNARHAWRHDEALHYVKWVRVKVWQGRTSGDG